MGLASRIRCHHAGSLVLASAVFLGGCASAPAPIDKIANSQALSACAVAGLKTILRAQFKKAETLEQAGQILPNTSEEFAVILAESALHHGLKTISAESDSAMLIESCVSQAVIFPADKIPLTGDGEIETEFATHYFDVDEFEQKIVESFPVLLNDMVDEALRRRAQRGITAPSDFLRPGLYK